jgi:hypothetical protein
MKNRIFIACLVFAVFTICAGTAQQVYKTLTLTENGTVAAPTNFLLGVANGGTGGTNAATARTALGLGTAATTDASVYPTLAGNNTFSGSNTFTGNLTVNAGYVSVSDANYTIRQNDRVVAVTALTAARVITLPAASSVPSGTQIIIQDRSGLVSQSLSITIQRSGSDTIYGATQENASVSSLIEIRRNFSRIFFSNGSNQWFEPGTLNCRTLSFPADTQPNTGISWTRDGITRSSGVSYETTMSKLRVVSNKRVDLIPGGDFQGDGFIQMGNAEFTHDFAYFPSDGTASASTPVNLPSKAQLFIANFWNGSASSFKISGIQGDVDTSGNEGLLFLVGGNNNGVTPSFTRTIRGTEVARVSSVGLTFAGVGHGIRLKEGTNARMGVVTLVGGTATVANTSVTANSRIFLTSQTDGGTPGFLRVSARSAGTSFTITSGSGTDTSTVAWVIFEPTP